MNIENDLELIMECNVGIKAVISERYSKLIPCATSTPIRKPLHSLSNLRVLNGTERYNFLASKGDCSAIFLSNEANESLMVQEVKKENVQGKRKREEDIWSSSSSDEDVNVKQKKQLVIKIGSSHKNGESSRKKLQKKRLLNTLKNQLRTNIRKKAKGGPYEEKDTKKNTVLENEQNIKIETRNLQLKTNTNLKSVLDHQRGSESVEKAKEVSKILPVTECSENEKHITKLNECEKCKELVVHDAKTNNKMLLQNGQPPNMSGSSAITFKNTNDYNQVIQSKFMISKNKTRKKVKDFTDLRKKLVTHNADYENIGKNDLLNVIPSSYKVLSDGKEEKLKNMKHQTISETEVLPSNDIGVDNCEENKPGDSPKRIMRPKRTKTSPKEFWLPKSEANRVTSSEEYVENHEKENKLEDKAISSLMEPYKQEFGNSSFALTKKNATPTYPSSSFVKTLSQMEFTGDVEQYSTAVAWQFPFFKCCILKIHKKSEVSGRTKSRNSHFGGILLKGKLLMKIQGLETSLTEGQMFYVPPLTDWTAFNCGRIDCAVYYWCGRF